MKNIKELNRLIEELKKEIRVQFHYINSWGSYDVIKQRKIELELLEAEKKAGVKKYENH